MTVKLNDELRQALAAEGDTPVRIVDERSNIVYVLLREDAYERVKSFLEEDEFDVRSAYPLMDAVAAHEGWDDPEMDSYNALDPRNKT